MVKIAKKTGITANSIVSMAIITFCLWIWLFTPISGHARGLYKANGLTEGKEFTVYQYDDVIVLTVNNQTMYDGFGYVSMIFNDSTNKFKCLYEQTISYNSVEEIRNEGIYIAYNGTAKRYEEDAIIKPMIYLPMITRSSK